MAELKVYKTLHMGKGISMRILLDDTKPADSLDRWINEVTCEGGPDSDTLVVPLHWHKYHSERSNVVEGRAEVTLDGKARVVTAGEETYIPAGVVHGIKGFKGERAVLRERADPPGDYKSIFFIDMLSTPKPGSFWHTMRTFYDGDAYPALGLHFRFFDVAFINVFGGIAKLFMPGKRLEKLD